MNKLKSLKVAQVQGCVGDGVCVMMMCLMMCLMLFVMHDVVW